MSEVQEVRSGCLYVVATPIGHLDDMTFRAVHVLKHVQTIAAEDTRHTRRLLQHHEISGARLVSLHEHSQSAEIARLLEALNDQAVALVSDAGTPLISDPGFELVSAAWRAGHTVVPVPGASSLTALLSVCPLPAANFSFVGFLPSKRTAAARRLEELRQLSGAVVMFEAPHRMVATLQILDEHFPHRRVFIGRELTKQFETLYMGTPAELIPQIEAEHRGEFVLVLEPWEPPSSIQGEALLAELAEHLPPRTAARITAKFAGGESREWYRRLLDQN